MSVSEINERKGSSELRKVSMNLTPKDFENSFYLKKMLNERNQASVVSRSMAITSHLTKLVSEDPNNKIIIVNGKTGEKTEIILVL